MIKGKIVSEPFPFDDLSSQKVRPALCLTDAIGNHDHIILAFMSSRIPTYLLPSDVIIGSGHSDFVMTGLKVSSTLRLHRMMTVSKSLIKRELGLLSSSLHEEVGQKLKQLFGLNN